MSRRGRQADYTKSFEPHSELADWVTRMRWKGLSERTVVQFHSVVLRAGGWLDEDDPVTALLAADHNDVMGWLTTEVGHLKASSRRNYRNALQSFYRWARDADIIELVPTDRIEAPKTSQLLPRPIPTEQLERGIAWAWPLMKVMLTFGAYQGLRCAEVAGVRWEDIDGDWMIVNAEGAKGSKERRLPLHPNTRRALMGLDAEDRRGWVVTDHEGDRRPAHWVSQTISRYLHEAVGVTLDRPAHALRHWYATEVYRASGGDLLLTQRLLGHASPATTAVYAEPTRDAAEVVALIA